MNSSITFLFNQKLINVDGGALSPTTTLLTYLRSLPASKGVKEGCAEGDCGACTVVIGEISPDGHVHYRAVDSCLVFLPMIHRKQLMTVEELAPTEKDLHPVQQAMVETGGSQCGYCTPGFIMSMFALYKSTHHPSRAEIDDALTGNLCRCTGYRPIVEAAARACVHDGKDRFSSTEKETKTTLSRIPRVSLRISTGAQEYVQPLTLKEALEFKLSHPDAIVISGATDVALRVTKKHERLPIILDLSSVDELKRIADDGASLRVGAAAPLTDLMPHVRDCFPALYHILSVFGSRQIRNLATLGGNLATASPIGDTLPVLIAYRGIVVLQNLQGSREVPIDEFIVGYRQTAKKPDELITEIVIPKPTKNVVVRSYKVSKRKDLDISTVNASFRLELDDRNAVSSIILAYGGMAGRTKRAQATEEYLHGKTWTRSMVERALPLLETEFTPISDVRGGAEFRRIVARNLLLKFWRETAAHPAVMEQ